MGSCSSNHEDINGGEGFNPGDQNGDQGFNPGGESNRPNSRQAGNMAPNPEQPRAEEAAANSEPQANSVPHGNLVSPQMGAMQPPQGMGAQGPAAPQGGGAGRPWIDFDPRTNKPMLANGQAGFQESAGNNIPLDNADANRQAFELAARSGLNEQANGPGPMEEMPPQAGQPYGSPLIIGAVSADVSNGQIVSDGHWEEFDAANNVMSLEDYHASLGTNL